MPVRWSDCVRSMAGQGATRIVECGPGKVLTGLVKRIDKSLEARAVGSPAEFDAALAELR
jgi:[acyl-carrier-protein] S-malonyltransferase